MEKSVSGRKLGTGRKQTDHHLYELTLWEVEDRHFRVEVGIVFDVEQSDGSLWEQVEQLEVGRGSTSLKEAQSYAQKIIDRYEEQFKG